MSAQNASKKNAIIVGILFIIAKYQKSFMDQSFLLGYEGGALGADMPASTV